MYTKIIFFNKKYNINDSLTYIDNEGNTISLEFGIQEIIITKLLNKFSNFYFTQKLLNFNIYSDRCIIDFKKLEVPIEKILCTRNFKSNCKFICFIVIFFLIKSYDEFKFNHNDLKINNLVFDKSKKYTEELQKGFTLGNTTWKLEIPKYVPFIIDFEMSQIFSDEFNKKKILEQFINEPNYNISSYLNPIYNDIFKFLMSFRNLLSFDDFYDKFDNVEFIDILYNRIFNNNIQYKNNFDFFLKFSSIDLGVNKEIKNKMNNKQYSELINYLFDVKNDY